MSDYAVQIRVRNARILRRMRELGIPSQTELARRAGISMTALNALVGLKQKPLGHDGEWRGIVQNIAAVLRCDPEELFSDTQRDLKLERNNVEIEVDEARVVALTAGDPEQAAWAKLEVQHLLEGLSPRHRYIMEQRLEGASFDEIGAALDISGKRVRQVEQVAMRKMKYAKVRSDSALSRRFAEEDNPPVVFPRGPEIDMDLDAELEKIWEPKPPKPEPTPEEVDAAAEAAFHYFQKANGTLPPPSPYPLPSRVTLQHLAAKYNTMRIVPPARRDQHGKLIYRSREERGHVKGT